MGLQGVPEIAIMQIFAHFSPVIIGKNFKKSGKFLFFSLFSLDSLPALVLI